VASHLPEERLAVVFGRRVMRPRPPRHSLSERRSCISHVPPASVLTLMRRMYMSDLYTGMPASVVISPCGQIVELLRLCRVDDVEADVMEGWRWECGRRLGLGRSPRREDDRHGQQASPRRACSWRPPSCSEAPGWLTDGRAQRRTC